MSFPRYPEYKDSGVEWLGWVPSHWSVKAIKWLSPVLRGASPRPIDDPKYFDDDGEYAWVRIADSTASTGMLTETTQRLSALGSSLSVKLEIGQLFVSIAGTVGKPCITAIKACIHDGFVYFPRLQINPKFLFRIFEAGVCYGGLGKLGTQLNLNTDTIGSIRIAVPPPEEMTEVLSFIDRETAKIDALVAEQEKLIALLQEKRQAVISHAVTKGLDPNVPMKDSGVEWLGEVPGHWKVMPIRLAARLESGHTPSRSRPDWWQDCTVPWFTLADVWQIRDGGADVVYETKELVSELGLANSSARLLPKGTVMLSRTASVGFSAIMGVDMATTQDFANWVCSEELRPEFLLQVFRSMKGEYRRLMMGSTHNTIYMPDIQAFRFALPPVPEQLRIVDHIKEKASTFDDLISEAQVAVRLLTERRTALISAAVTGQIDVRGLVGGAIAPNSIAASAYPASDGG